MAEATKPDIVLYDLKPNNDQCFSPAVWRIRLALNYKKIPYRTEWVEFPDLEATLKPLGIAPAAEGPKYTVPAIHHIPTDKYIMDSAAIHAFLESTYPATPIPWTSELGDDIADRLRKAMEPAFHISITGREIHILPPRSQVHFRRTREVMYGCTLEELLAPGKEEEGWRVSEKPLREVGELMRTHADQGPFVLGAKPSGTDFFIAGRLQWARMVDEGVFQKFMKFPGLKDVYEACEPYMNKRN